MIPWSVSKNGMFTKYVDDWLDLITWRKDLVDNWDYSVDEAKRIFEGFLDMCETQEPD